MTDKIRNIRAFTAAYLKSDAGKSALNRSPIRVKDKNGKPQLVFKSPLFANAFQKALGK